MINSIRIEYRTRGNEGEWLLFKYVAVQVDEGQSEIYLLRQSFPLYEFRYAINVTEKPTINYYDREKNKWTLWIE